MQYSGVSFETSYVLVICLNPVLQNTHLLPRLVPGQVNRAAETLRDIAGKGINTTRIIQQLGGSAVNLTQLGGHNLGEFLDLVASDALEVEWVDSHVPVRYCHTLIEEESGTVTEIVEEGSPIAPAVEAAVREAYDRLVAKAHTVVIAGSKAPGFSDTVFPDMVEAAHRAGAKVIIDYRGEDLLASLDRGVDVVKINVSEFAQTFMSEPLPENIDPSSIPPELFSRLEELERAHNFQVVLTNGAKPVFVTKNGTVETLDPEAVEAKNTIGCGDAVSAGIAVGLHRGLELSGAVALGLDAAKRNALQIRPGRLS